MFVLVYACASMMQWLQCVVCLKDRLDKGGGHTLAQLNIHFAYFQLDRCEKLFETSVRTPFTLSINFICDLWEQETTHGDHLVLLPSLPLYFRHIASRATNINDRHFIIWNTYDNVNSMASQNRQNKRNRFTHTKTPNEITKKKVRVTFYAQQQYQTNITSFLFVDFCVFFSLSENEESHKISLYVDLTRNLQTSCSLWKVWIFWL